MPGRIFVCVALLALAAPWNLSTAAHDVPNAAKPEAGYTPPQAPPTPSPVSLLARLFAMTLFVLLLCAGVLWAIRHFQRQHLSKAVDPSKLRVIEEVMLSHRCAIQLVQVGDARVVFAVDQSGLKACHVVDSHFAGVLSAVESTPPPQPSPTVADMLAMLNASRRAA